MQHKNHIYQTAILQLSGAYMFCGGRVAVHSNRQTELNELFSAVVKDASKKATEQTNKKPAVTFVEKKRPNQFSGKFNRSNGLLTLDIFRIYR